MINFPLAAVSFLMSVVAVVFVITCVGLILIILIQKGKGGGLGAALGGAGGAGSLFGTKTGDFLTWVTIAFTVIFLFLSVIMGLFYKPRISESEAFQGQRQAQQPIQTATQAPESQTAEESSPANQPVSPDEGQE